jgi:hypothetical protein
MIAFFKNLDFGPRILLLLASTIVINFFGLGFATRELPWANQHVVIFLLLHTLFVGVAVFVGVRITTEHALSIIKEVRDAYALPPVGGNTRPASSQEELLQQGSELLKQDAQEWREGQGLPLSGLPHRLPDADSEEAMPEPAMFVADDPDHEGPGEEDGPWAEGYDERRDGTHDGEDFGLLDTYAPVTGIVIDAADKAIDPSTADGPFASGTTEEGRFGTRTW